VIPKERQELIKLAVLEDGEQPRPAGSGIDECLTHGSMELAGSSPALPAV
jgi:hypothetical protein